MTIIGLFAIAVLAIVLGFAYRTLVKHPADVFAITIYLSCYFFIARPFVLATGLGEPFPHYLFGDFMPQLVQGVFLVTLYFIAMIAGAMTARGPSLLVGRLFPAVDILPRPQITIYFAAAFALIAFLITAALVARYGSLGGVMEANKKDKALAGAYVLKMFGTLSVYFSLIVILLWTYYRERGLKLSVFMAPIGFLGFFTGMVSTYAWGSRWDTAMGLLGFGLGYFYYRNKLNLGRMAMLAAGLLALLLGMRLVRDLTLAGRIYTPEENPIDTVMVANHGVYFDAFMLLVRDFGHRIPLRWGEDYVLGFLGAVPRALWPDKPPGNAIFPGAWFRQIYEPHIINGWPFTTPGEWMVNFGYPGIVIGGYLGGVVFRSLQLRNASIHTNPIALVLSIIYAGLMFDHGINNVWFLSYAYFAPPIFFYMFLLRLYGPVQFPSVAPPPATPQDHWSHDPQAPPGFVPGGRP